MDNKRKKIIDDLWKNTEYGQWVMLSARGKQNEADELAEKMIAKYPFRLDTIDKDVSVKIASNIKDSDEFDDYMKELDSADPELVEFMISHDIFGKVFDILNNN